MGSRGAGYARIFLYPFLKKQSSLSRSGLSLLPAVSLFLSEACPLNPPGSSFASSPYCSFAMKCLYKQETDSILTRKVWRRSCLRPLPLRQGPETSGDRASEAMRPEEGWGCQSGRGARACDHHRHLFELQGAQSPCSVASSLR